MQFPNELLRQCWILAGPTASGKSTLGLQLAERIDAEIIALDSMTLYRGMDIGTAKPSEVDRIRVPHHLLDIVDPADEFSVVDFLHAAQETCKNITSRGKTPLFVGGTGMYLKALLRGVFPGPAADWEFRKKLEKTAREEGSEALWGQLHRIDPKTANRLSANDVRRVIRAIEVHELTGVPMSAQQQQMPLPIEQRPHHVYWLSPPRDWLHHRIEQRVGEMMDAGWLEEVRQLLSRELPLSRTASQALGYQELIAHLAGECTLSEAVEQLTIRTRQFAKRQHTWYRHIEECRPIEITGTETAEDLIQVILMDSK
ncbi:MAG: tRNA (adenosine(37)-N6)-dimethylallyltransferase MiaA [Planctomycetota bacterium]|nr:tRNA (adenosine(37)-N6)-dimethylallyltransferase MiaA [Planctomycetota bacterium]MDA1214135.1 tRNA (adenosine(37)-N6)-dimethylallyltransferase MiaA [Planctomycetota bacterium]